MFLSKITFGSPVILFFNLDHVMLSDGCRMLETLNLSWCDQITRDGIEALARGCIGIRALFLRGCTQVCTLSYLVYFRALLWLIYWTFKRVFVLFFKVPLISVYDTLLLLMSTLVKV